MDHDLIVFFPTWDKVYNDKDCNDMRVIIPTITFEKRQKDAMLQLAG